MNTWTLLFDLTWKSSAVLALSFVIASALRGRSAAARHIVWTAAFAALLALPLLSLGLPSWTHPLASALLPDSGAMFRADATAGAVHAGPSVAPAGAAVTRTARAAFDPRRAAVLAWTGGAILAFLHLLLAYASAWRLRRISVPSRLTAAEFGIDEAVALREIGDGMPMTAGVFRPAIFLPAESAEWSWERLRIVVAHEYAHIRRGDAAAQLLARTALCLQWFNPLAWFAWRRLLAERERAADDMVLAAGAQPSDYAGHLLEIARTLHSVPAGVPAGIAMARRSQLEGRLVAILDSRVKRGNPGPAMLAVALVAALALATPLATVRAQQSQAGQDATPDIDITIATANAQKNHEMLEQAAGAYEKLRKFAEAQKLREAALAIRKEAGPAQYAEGLVRMAELAQKRNAQQDAVNFYMQAVQVGDMAETSPALLNLGLDTAFRGQEPVRGLEYLQRARNVARTGDDAGRAMTWIAFLEQSDPAKIAEAESTYRAALAVETPGSSAQALTTELLARLLRTQDRGAEAESLENSAIGMRKALAAALSPVYQETGSSVMRVGNGTIAPKLILKVEPAYTEAARVLKVQGTVLLKVTIDVDGRAKDMQVIKGVGLGLDEKAVEAIGAWRFKPGELGGAPVPVQAQIEVNFRLL